MKGRFQRGRYLITNTIIFSIGNFSSKLISFFLVPFYTYVLTTEEYGTVDLIFTISTVVSPFLMFNIHEAIKRYCLDKDANYEAILTSASLVIIYGHLIGILMVPFLNCFDSISKYVAEIYFYTLCMTTNLIFVEYLRGREKMFAYTACGVVSSAAIAVLNILFLRYLHWGIRGYFLSYIIAYCISSTIAVIVGRQYIVLSKWKLDLELFKKMLLFSLPLIPNSLMWWVSNCSDRVMVTYILGTAANGIYTVSYKIPTMISTICNIFFQAWQFTAVKTKDTKDKEKFTNEIFDIYMRIVFMFSSILLILIKPFMKIYVSPQFFDAWRYTPVLIIGTVFASLGTFVGTPYYVEKDMKGNLFSAMVGAGINIILNFVLIPKIGIQGAAIATCISYISVFLYRVLDTRKYIRLGLWKIRYLMYITELLILLILSFSEYLEKYLLIGIILCFQFVDNAIFVKNTMGDLRRS